MSNREIAKWVGIFFGSMMAITELGPGMDDGSLWRHGWLEGMTMIAFVVTMRALLFFGMAWLALRAVRGHK